MEEYKGKEGLVDTLGNISYSLIVGSVLDYAVGLRGLGIAASRAYATGVNLPTAAPYGKWRNFIFDKTRTTDSSGKLRKSLADLLAFNTFQVPVYASAIAVGSLISEGKIDPDKVLDGARKIDPDKVLDGARKIDPDKVLDGARNLAIVSPLIGPTMGWYMDKLRVAFNLKSAAEKAKGKSQNGG